MNRLFKNLVSMILCLLLISSAAFASTIPQQNAFKNSTTIEALTIEELSTRSDVKNFISKSGYENPENNIKIYNLLNKGSQNNKFSYNEKQRVANALGLNLSKTAMLGDNTKIIVEKNNFRVSNVWYLTYIPTDSGFSINVLNVGRDPLDKISGTVVLKKLNRDTWVSGASHTFNKVSVRSGNVTTWNISKEAVAENFEYDIKVVEDGQTWSYNNKDEINKFRYNFEAGSYNTLQAKGGERHHLVSSAALSSTGYSSSTAPCIRMIARDHRQTPSWGSSANAIAFRATEKQMIQSKKFSELMHLEVDSLKAIADPGGNYSSIAQKYADSIVIAVILYEQYFGFKM